MVQRGEAARWRGLGPARGRCAGHTKERRLDGSRSTAGRGRWAGDGQGTLCPVCLKMVPGDPDVVEAHVDACLAHEARVQSERERSELEERRRSEQAWEEVDIDDDLQLRATEGASLRGTCDIVLNVSGLTSD